MKVESQGQLLLSGSESQPSFVVYQLASNGSLDTGFGAGGKTLVSFNGALGFGKRLALTNTSKAVVAGSIFPTATNDLGLARLDVGGVGTGPNPNTPSITLSAPLVWFQGQKQAFTWTTTQVDGKRPVEIQFSKNGGVKFKTLKTVPNKKGGLSWKPGKSATTEQGVLKICVKPGKQMAKVCSSANIVVLPKE